MQLALLVQLPVAAGGWAGGAYYVSTEGGLPPHRLAQIGDALARSRGLHAGFMDRVLVQSVANLGGLRVALVRARRGGACVFARSGARGGVSAPGRGLPPHRRAHAQSKVPELVSSKNVRLVIVDSVANVLRTDFGDSQKVCAGVARGRGRAWPVGRPLSAGDARAYRRAGWREKTRFSN